jgi:hypothetical protein
MTENHFQNVQSHKTCHSVIDIRDYFLTFSHFTMTNCEAVSEMWTVMHKKQILWKSTVELHMQALDWPTKELFSESS